MFVYAPVCNSTIDISNRFKTSFVKKLIFFYSFSNVFPEDDGILIIAGTQLRGRGKLKKIFFIIKLLRSKQ